MLKNYRVYGEDTVTFSWFISSVTSSPISPYEAVNQHTCIKSKVPDSNLATFMKNYVVAYYLKA